MSQVKFVNSDVVSDTLVTTQYHWPTNKIVTECQQLKLATYTKCGTVLSIHLSQKHLMSQVDETVPNSQVSNILNVW